MPLFLSMSMSRVSSRQSQIRLDRTTLPPAPLPLFLMRSTLSSSGILAFHNNNTTTIRRYYWYIPLSWEELKMRLRVEREKRVIQVKLLQDRWTTKRHAKRLRRRLRRQERQELMVRQLQNSLQEQSEALSKNMTSLWQQTKQRARTPKRALQQSQRQTPLQLTTRDHDWNTIQQVTLTEYNQLDWFDAYGRPLTSKESGTGRYVNPWRSQSTAGVHSLYSILHWRYQRLLREYRHVGWQCMLPASLRTRQTTQQAMVAADTAAARNHATAQGESTQLNQDTWTTNAQSNSLVLTWIGHATCLIQQGDLTILTDPMFSYKASPSQWVPGLGVGRIVEPACRISDLPNHIDICLISHDHYDHLDRISAIELRDRVAKWVVPLGIAQWLQDKCQIPSHRIVEMEWWDSIRWKRQRRPGGGLVNGEVAPLEYKPVEFVSIQDSPVTHPARLREETELKKQQRHADARRQKEGKTTDGPTTPPQQKQQQQSDSSFWITCCPAQHWSSRTLFDRNLRLWCGFYLVLPNEQTFYFAGDTALPQEFPLFEQLSDYINRPIHLAAIPIGAYEPSFFMRDAHVDPDQAIRIHERMRCLQSVGIHWGSFPLSEEDMGEPPKWLERSAREAHVDFKTIPVGASIVVDAEEDNEEEEDDDDDDDDNDDENDHEEDSEPGSKMPDNATASS